MQVALLLNAWRSLAGSVLFNLLCSAEEIVVANGERPGHVRPNLREPCGKPPRVVGKSRRDGTRHFHRRQRLRKAQSIAAGDSFTSPDGRMARRVQLPQQFIRLLSGFCPELDIQVASLVKAVRVGDVLLQLVVANSQACVPALHLATDGGSPYSCRHPTA